MTKVRKVKRRKSYKVNINRKRLRNKLRKLPTIECKDIKEAWEDKKSTRHNLKDMGLAYDPNDALKIPNFKKESISKAKCNSLQDSPKSNEEISGKFVPTKLHIAQNLEAEAKAPRERNFRLPNQQVQFLTYLMDKYGDDYKSMARDKKNHYQLTWRQIRSKINTFKGVPEQYAEYLLKKGEIILNDAETLEETRRRIAADNVAKYSTPKVKKIKKTSQWLEEDVAIFDTGDKLEDIEEDKNDDTENSNKLKLFSDDESEEEDKMKKSKASRSKLVVSKNVKGKDSTERVGKIEKITDGNGKSEKRLVKLASSDSDSEEELEGSENDTTDLVNLEDLSDEELSDDDILDNSDFVTDSDEESC